MSQGHSPALELAIAAFRAPSLYAQLRDRTLPDGLPLLLRIVSGDGQAIQQAGSLINESPKVVTEAAVMVIQQLMFYPGADSYRVLGVAADADDGQIRDNYRWLVRWLHPDRNNDEWDAVYADRVTTAWNDLRTLERRQRYDENLRGFGEASHGNHRGSVSMVRQAEFVEEVAPSLDLRWLPKAVFAGLGVCVLSALAVFYVLRSSGQGPGSGTESSELAVAEAGPPETTNQFDPGFTEAALVPAPALAEPPPPAPPEPALATAEALSPAHSDVESLARLAEPREVATDDSAGSREAAKPALARPMKMAPTDLLPNVHLPAAVASVEPTPAAGKNPSPPVAPSAGAAAVPDVVALSVRAPRAVDSPAPDSRRADVGLVDANRILAYFSQAYADGDLNGMRAIFTADARSSRGGLGAILANYGQLFESSSDRSLVVRDVSWFVAGETATIIASYQATVTEGRGRRLRRTHGDLRLDLRRENEQWRIFRLLHDERPG